jgi:hypothetical protein
MQDFNAFTIHAFSDFHLVDVRHPWKFLCGVVSQHRRTRENRKMTKVRIASVLLVTAWLTVLTAACSSEPEISFTQDVRPILDKNCLSCHQAGGSGFEASGFSMASYDELMKGTEGGPMIIPGDVEGSNLLVLMEGRADPSISMPHGSLDSVPGADIAVIRNWIAQGAKNN